MVPLKVREQLEGIGSFLTKWSGTQRVLRLGGKCHYLLSYLAIVDIFMGLVGVRRFTKEKVLIPILAPGLQGGLRIL